MHILDSGNFRKCLQIKVHDGDAAAEEDLTLKYQIIQLLHFQVVGQGRIWLTSELESLPLRAGCLLGLLLYLSLSFLIFKMQITELSLTLGYL